LCGAKTFWDELSLLISRFMVWVQEEMALLRSSGACSVHISFLEKEDLQKPAHESFRHPFAEARHRLEHASESETIFIVEDWPSVSIETRADVLYVEPLTDVHLTEERFWWIEALKNLGSSKPPIVGVTWILFCHHTVFYLCSPTIHDP